MIFSSTCRRGSLGRDAPQNRKKKEKISDGIYHRDRNICRHRIRAGTAEFFLSLCASLVPLYLGYLSGGLHFGLSGTEQKSGGAAVFF